jgi:hypothetical protein
MQMRESTGVYAPRRFCEFAGALPVCGAPVNSRKSRRIKYSEIVSRGVFGDRMIVSCGG